MNLEIVDSKIHHCGKMARNARQKWKENSVLYDKNAHRIVYDDFNRSMICKTAILDGKVISMGGAVSDFISDICYVWFIGSDFNIKMKLSIMKELIRNIKNILITKKKVYSFFDLNDKEGMRMAEFLGFEPSLDISHNHGSYIIMEINKENFRR